MFDSINFINVRKKYIDIIIFRSREINDTWKRANTTLATPFLIQIFDAAR